MGWLVGYTLASIVTSFIVVKIFDYIFAGATDALVSSARFGLFVITWTVITAKMGMHGFTKRVRQLKTGIAKDERRIRWRHFLLVISCSTC